MKMSAVRMIFFMILCGASFVKVIGAENSQLYQLSLKAPLEEDFKNLHLIDAYRRSIDSITGAAKEVKVKDPQNRAVEVYFREKKRLESLEEGVPVFDSENQGIVRAIVAVVEDSLREKRTKKVVLGLGARCLQEIFGVRFDDQVGNTPEGHQHFIEINGTASTETLSCLLPGAFFIQYALQKMVEEEKEDV